MADHTLALFHELFVHVSLIGQVWQNHQKFFAAAIPPPTDQTSADAAPEAVRCDEHEMKYNDADRNKTCG